MMQRIFTLYQSQYYSFVWTGASYESPSIVFLRLDLVRNYQGKTIVHMNEMMKLGLFKGDLHEKLEKCVIRAIIVNTRVTSQ